MVELSVLEIKLLMPRPQDDHPDDRVSSSFQLSHRDFFTLCDTLSLFVLSSLPREVSLLRTAHEPRTCPLALNSSVFLFVHLGTKPTSVWSWTSCGGCTGIAWAGSPRGTDSLVVSVLQHGLICPLAGWLSRTSHLHNRNWQRSRRPPR